MATLEFCSVVTNLPQFHQRKDISVQTLLLLHLALHILLLLLPCSAVMWLSGAKISNHRETCSAGHWCSHRSWQRESRAESRVILLQEKKNILLSSTWNMLATWCWIDAKCWRIDHIPCWWNIVLKLGLQFVFIYFFVFAFIYLFFFFIYCCL